MVSEQVLDFSCAEVPDSMVPHFTTGRAKRINPKQIRARARRHARKFDARMGEELSLLHKPIDQWDNEELARGRVRAMDGTFKGKSPEWISRALHEQAMERFRGIIRGEMQVHTIKAVRTLEWLLDDDSCDEKGRPIVPPATKLAAAQFVVEHLLGKPKQEVKNEISVKLQGILATATVAVSDAQIALPQYTDVESWEVEDEDG